ncbi:LOW QUALITY PROTEIN: ankyrin repeat domain-containing protein SOWAHA-like [Plectropomus leopardus]|uniref:LOW QUALITY PROTEIN: ankyrin repeat domain-containing protein SOWAHA-like n=1 Tax=Plectropomus leopardus TaxID=160734 RepID=UPI001C4C3B62|nr:LOW QUALITY PROTEIN: ankyrin repeat domain-containing protein SOWAHA-like [Plectropomus leopardus]
MSLTQESVLFLLISEGGKVKKPDLVCKFKAFLDCEDTAQKERNRELFKTFVNNVAVVKEIDGVRYVVVRKVYQHLLDGAQAAQSPEGKTEEPTGELQRPPARQETGSSGDARGGERSAEPDQEQESKSGENPTEILSPIQLALQRSKLTDVRVKRTLTFGIQSQDTNRGTCSRTAAVDEPDSVKNKPYALPLRMPPSATKVEIHKLKMDPDDPPESPFRNKRRPPSVETSGSVSPPQLRRSVKSTKASEEPKETRVPSLVPLEQSEHEWLVKCAAGHWSQVYGLLLRDNQLAEKRDFMSGFTALHWAAKCGNSDMLVKIIDLSRQGGVDIDINAKTHGGYTPLHIAALHDQEYIMAMLVGEHGADPSIRDNCGKRAYHYLHKGISMTVREMLGEPKAREAPDRAVHEKEESDLLPDLSRGLSSFSRLFQPHVMSHKKKQKRPTFFSLSDEPSEEREDSSFRHGVVSDVFM